MAGKYEDGYKEYLRRLTKSGDLPPILQGQATQYGSIAANLPTQLGSVGGVPSTEVDPISVEEYEVADDDGGVYQVRKEVFRGSGGNLIQVEGWDNGSVTTIRATRYLDAGYSEEYVFNQGEIPPTNPKITQHEDYGSGANANYASFGANFDEFGNYVGRELEGINGVAIDPSFLDALQTSGIQTDLSGIADVEGDGEEYWFDMGSDSGGADAVSLEYDPGLGQWVSRRYEVVGGNVLIEYTLDPVSGEILGEPNTYSFQEAVFGEDVSLSEMRNARKQPQFDPEVLAVQVAGTIGSIIGSQLASLFETNNVAFALFTSTFSSTIGSYLLSNIASGHADDINLADFKDDLSGSFQGAIGGFAGSYFGKKLAGVLGVDEKYGELVGGSGGTATGSYYAGQVLHEAKGWPYRNPITNEPITLGGTIGTAVPSAVGSYFANQLATQLFHGNGLGASIGGQIGSAIGAYAGSVIPGLGTFLGSTLGSFIGNAIGGLFGPGSSVGPNANANVNFVDGQWVLGSTGSDNGGDVQIPIGMATGAIDMLNGMVETIGGTAVQPGGTVGYAYFANGPVFYAGGNSFPDIQQAVKYGTLESLRGTVISGGDVYMKRALLNSDATSLEQLILDVDIGRQWGIYQDNPELFEFALTGAPQDVLDFWAQVQQRAASLQLDTPSTADQYGYEPPLPDDVFSTGGGGTQASSVTAPQGTGSDPIVIDLGRDGVQMISMEQSSVLFEMDMDGFLENTGWIDGSDGFLVHDRNHNGYIDNISEMFSEYYDPANAASGFAALATLDTNADGVFSDEDAAYGEVRVWQDVNQNGKTDLGELKSLDRLGIYAISLNTSLLGTTVGGNVMVAQTNFGQLGQTMGSAYDVWFAHGGLGVTFENFTALGEGWARMIFEDRPSIAFRTNVGAIDLTFDSTLATHLAGGLDNDIFTATGAGDVMVDGNGGADILAGANGNDWLVGGAGSDIIHGGAGNDTIFIDAEDLLQNIDGGAGIDKIVYEGAAGLSLDLAAVNAEVAILDDGDDVVSNSGNADVAIDGAGGNDAISGGGGADRLDGGAGNDHINGGAGNDTLIGGAGSDTLTGGAGNDVLMIDAEDLVQNLDAGDGLDMVIVQGEAGVSLDAGQIHAEIVYGAAGNDTLTNSGVAGVDFDGGDGADLLSGGDAVDTLRGGAGNDTLSGGAGADVLQGGSGDDLLSGGAGADNMEGGAGDDVYVVDNAEDAVIELAGEGHDRVEADVSYTLGATVEDLTLTGAANIDGAGNSMNNVIVGNAGNNSLSGGAGADVISGGAGDDTLDGGTGADVLSGGLGGDAYLLDSSADQVIENTDEGIDGVVIAASYTLGNNVENLTLTGTIGLSGTGNALDNAIAGTAGADSLLGLDGSDTLSGGGGDDTLDGGAGADTLIGGLGNDTYYVDSSADVVVEQAGEGTDTVLAAVSYALGGNIENLMLTGASNTNGTGDDGNNVITGNAGVNVLSGGAGNDTLDGGAGADTLIGGAGDDLYVLDNAGDTVTEAAGEGYDRVQSAVSFVSTGNIEEITLTGTAHINAAGDDGADIITGNSGNNIIDGGAGADVMNGGAGNDTYYVDDVNDTITDISGNDTIMVGFSYALGSGGSIDNITLTGTADLNAYGNAFANILTGNSGNNILDGGSNNDTLIGGAGDDVYYISTYDVITENAGEGYDIAYVNADSSFTYWTQVGSYVEEIHMLSSGKLEANSQNNTIYGSSGKDEISGGGGADTMIGGLGNDYYYVDNINDVVVEHAGEGNDSIEATSSFTLMAGSSIETITGKSTGITLEGNELDNFIIANNASNTLIGGAGNDTLQVWGANSTIYGGSGNDILQNQTATASVTFYGGAGDDHYYGGTYGGAFIEYEGEGIDTIHISTHLTSYTIAANIENLEFYISDWYNFTLTGNELDNIITVLATTYTGNTIDAGAGNDTIYGGNRNDTIIGGAGDDAMYGGAGNDAYFVDSEGDIVVDTGGVDTIHTGASYVLSEGIENLVLLAGALNGTGNAVNNTITGNAGNNILDGGAGNDTLIGGAGDDVYIVDSASDVITENAGEGNDTVKASYSYTISGNIENLELLGTADLNGIGSAQNNVIIGNAGNNILDGGAGADTLIGGAGNDTYVIDGVADTIVEAIGGGVDAVQVNFSYDLSVVANVENVVLGGTANINVTGNAEANALTGNSGNNILDGGAGDDTLNAGAGDDTLVGGSGADILIGGTGNDTYVVDNFGDQVIELPGGGTDIVMASTSYSISENVDNLTLTGSADTDGTGNGQDNVLTGNAGVNTLIGGAGNDTLDGGASVDTLIGGLGDDIYYVDGYSDIIIEYANEGFDSVYASVSIDLSIFDYGGIENITLTGAENISITGDSQSNNIVGNSGANVLLGGAGDDIINGGAGADTMVGGSGNDTFYVDNVADIVSENEGEGADTVYASVNFVLQNWVENLILTGVAASGTGNSQINTITGTGGANILDGGGGADILNGGAGNDVYVIDDTGDQIIDSSGTDTVQSYISYTLAANLENLTLLGAGNINATGNSGNNVLYGNSANNILDGISGNDTMSGGAGNDVYVINGGDTVIENAGEGIDTIIADFSYTLAANLENATLVGTATSLTGNSVDNILQGNSANNSINGAAGADTMIGGSGNDTYYVDNAGDSIVENAGEGYDLVYAAASHAMGGNVEDLTLQGSAAINGTGNAADNVITGNSGVNTIIGGGGNDTLYGNQGNDTLLGDVGNDALDGGSGADVMAGGAGDDTYYYDAGDTLTELADDGIDTVVSGISFVLAGNFENLTLTGSANNTTATGNAADNVIIGSGQSNTLDGKEGADTMSGGAGNDIYYVDNIGDLVIEVAGQGTDTVQSAVDYALTANVENLVLTGSAAVGTGNDLGNIITGNIADNTLSGGGGDDTLDGGAGADTLIGGLGNDTYYVDSSADVVLEQAGEGTDTVLTAVSYALGGNIENLTLTGASNTNGTGDDGNNVITGNAGVNVLSGGAGNDTLDGGAGADSLIGGTGDDLYVLDNAGDTVTEAAGEGYDRVQSAVSFVSTGNIEEITLTGTAHINAAGDDGADIITGNSGNNIIDGGAGADVMNGGAGNDTYYVDDVNDTITDISGNDTIMVGFSYALGSGGSIDNITLTGTADLNAYGNAFANILTGNSGNNILDGGSNNDTLIGGAGDDVYYISTYDVITENAGEGYDIAYVNADSSFTYWTQVGSYVEEIHMLSSGKLEANSQNNTIYGSSGKDEISGGGGADTMIGGLGNDYYYVDNINDVVVEHAGEGNDSIEATSSFTLMAGSSIETITGKSTGITLEGNELDNFIIANNASNTLIGGAGNDTLQVWGANSTIYGGSGNDILQNQTATASVTFYGGAGDDHYYGGTYGGAFIEYEGEGIDTIHISTHLTSYTIAANIENLEFYISDWYNFTLTGNELDNIITVLATTYTGNTIDAGAGNDTIYGGNRNDTIIGGAGDDAMYGGAGNDTYEVNDFGDTVVDTGGTDTVRSWISYALGSDIENLTLISGAINGIGNALNNTMTGTTQANILDGGAGNDTLIGGAGDDVYIIDSASDVITENAGEGNDTAQSSVSYTISANVENITLIGSGNINATGNGLGNTLIGNAGGNTLDGASGNDSLLGGLGNDTYIFGRGGGSDTVQDSDVTVGNNDIVQFQSSISTDQLWFSRSGDDLQVAIIGTTDVVTIDDWYVGATHQIEQFRTNDGKVLSNDNVDNLVNAMATFSAPAPGQTTLPAAYQGDLLPVIAANWH